MSDAQVAADVRDAASAVLTKAEKKLAELSAPAPGLSSREVDERATLKAEAELKLGQAKELVPAG